MDIVCNSSLYAVSILPSFPLYGALPGRAKYRVSVPWIMYVVDNNVPFTSSDPFCDVVKTMFPDSKIAQDFACRRTKTTSICKDMIENSQKEHFNGKYVFT